MTQRLLLTSLCLAALLTGGCLFSKKSKAKEDSAISGSVEASFRTRWLDRRVGELTAKGTAPAAARTQAEQEFAEKYVFTSPAQKK